MSLVTERLASELRELRGVARQSGGRIQIMTPGPSDRLVDRLVMQLRYRTALDASYPQRTIDRTTVTIVLPSNYPHAAPRASITPVIFHPHVYASGQFCADGLWTGGASLVTFLERIIQLIVLDASAINLGSSANPAAARWYRDAVMNDPGAFPSEAVSFADFNRRPKVNWNDK
jgi:ubiquitin-protein ligase